MRTEEEIRKKLDVFEKQVKNSLLLAEQGNKELWLTISRESELIAETLKWVLKERETNLERITQKL